MSSPNPSADSADPLPNVGTTLYPQEPLEQGQFLYYGAYRLTFNPDCTLVLTDPSGGSVRTWSPSVPVDSNTAVMYVDSRGAIQIKDGPHVLATLTEPVLASNDSSASASRLELGDGGEIVVRATDGKQYPVYDNPATPAPPADSAAPARGEHEFLIYHPPQESPTLSEAITLCQVAIDGLTSAAQVGTSREQPAPAPTVKGSLTAATLIDENWDSTMIRDYSTKLDDLRQVSDDLAKRDVDVRKVQADLPLQTEAALADIGVAVFRLNLKLVLGNMAAEEPATIERPLIQDIYDTIRAAEERIAKLWTDMNAAAGRVEPPPAAPGPGAEPGSGPPSGTGGAPEPGPPADPSSAADQSGNPATQASTGPLSDLIDMTDEELLGSGDLDGTAGLDGAGTDVEGLLDSLTNPGSGGVGIPAGSAGAAGNPMGDPAMLAAMMAAQVAPIISAAVSNVLTQQQRRQELDRAQEREEPDIPPPSEEPAPPPQPPAQTPPATSETASQAPSDSPPPAVSSPPRNVDLLLADKKYSVSSVVAEAVHNALNNPNGSDAVAAYSNTAGADQQSWNQITEAEVKTGDVAKWQNRTALVVMVDGKDMHMIVNGQLVPLDPNRPPEDGHGAYGNFLHFLHPAGTDVPADDPTATAAPVPAPPALPPPPEVTTSALR
ncbi:hypothetical protein [Nocardia brasiliensis]|uniref:hypothetical protein n=1 Tax=Nocardia brasiliensis TaxID=37326 RepID=UPI002453FEB9|nr:hypothetical protein [Nocardia brasiliensis]